jgi:hypothetical protein
MANLARRELLETPTQLPHKRLSLSATGSGYRSPLEARGGKVGLPMLLRLPLKILSVCFTGSSREISAGGGETETG